MPEPDARYALPPLVDDERSRSFAGRYDRQFAGAGAAFLGALRATLLAGLTGHVVEIGAGSGANLGHYRRADRIDLVEPLGSMREKLARRVRERPVAPDWGWAWPANRRILYNRASADPRGRPWSERKAHVWWDPGLGEFGEWTGYDVPDFPVATAPSYRPPPGVGGVAGLAGTEPFVMQSDGLGWLYAPRGVVDGPLPSHYEPQESPVAKPGLRPAAEPGPAAVSAPGQPDRAVGG